MTRNQRIEDGRESVAHAPASSSDWKQSDLLVAAAENRASGSLALSDEVSDGQLDPLTGERASRRTYSNALLSMLTKANRPEAFGRVQKVSAETIWTEIASDLDPPQVLRGRVA